MRNGSRWLRTVAVGASVLLAPLDAAAQALPRSSLAVEVDGRWHTWWRADRAPHRWPEAHPALVRSLAWRPAAPGVEWAEARLAGRGEAWRLRLVIVRLDPSRVRLRLVEATRAAGMLGAWTVDSLPADALVGFNAGQFRDGTPWGWVVLDGRELHPPGVGPLSTAVVVDSSGLASLVFADSIPAVRARGGIAQAFQSYPTLLLGEGEVPRQLRAPGRGVDLEHRDSRLAVGELSDGRLLVVLTRFEGLGGALSELPFGPTTAEMAAVMGGLGARRAVMLDGGISGQLRLREGGSVHSWRGMRRVPLALTVLPLPAAAGPPPGTPAAGPHRPRARPRRERVRRSGRL